MKKFKLTAQHYDMTPGTEVWEVPSLQINTTEGLFTVVEDKAMEPYFRMVPWDKVEPV